MPASSSKKTGVKRWFRTAFKPSPPISSGLSPLPNHPTSSSGEAPSRVNKAGTELVSTITRGNAANVGRVPTSPVVTPPKTPLSIEVTSAKDELSNPTSRGAIREGNLHQTLENFDLFLEVLKEVTEASEILGPMKVVCGVLLTTTKIVQMAQENGGDLEELRERLKGQSATLQRQIALYGACRYTRDGASYESLVISLTEYADALREIKIRLDLLQAKAQSELTEMKLESKVTGASIKDCVGHFCEAFDRYTRSITDFIAAQTASVNQQLPTEKTDLSLLRALPGANARGNQHELCLEGTRVHIIEQLEEWAMSGDAKPVMTIVDQAGKGKSTLAHTMARRWEKEGLLAGRFFFSRPTNVVNGKELATTLARNLTQCIPPIRPLISKAVEDHLEILQYSIDEQLQSLVFKPLQEYRKKEAAIPNRSLAAIREERRKKMYRADPYNGPRDSWEPIVSTMEDRASIVRAWREWKDVVETNHWVSTTLPSASLTENAYENYLCSVEASQTRAMAVSKPPIIIIDAIDECQREDQTQILHSFLSFLSKHFSSRPFKLLLTGRPEEEIVQALSEYPSILQDFSVSEGSSSHSDIERYSFHHLGNIGLTPTQIRDFVSRANGLFIWATTAATVLKKAYDKRVQFEALMKPSEGKSPLDDLYRQILQAVETEENQTVFLYKLLQAICVVRMPLTVEAMDELLQFQAGVAARIVASLRSVLSDGSNGEPVQVLHPTFIEFLLRQDSATSFAISGSSAELLLATGCMDTLNHRLRYEICDISDSSNITPDNVDIPDLDAHIQAKVAAGLRYASIYGISHIGSTLHDQGSIRRWKIFLEQHILHWVELMSLMGKIYPLIQSVYILKNQLRHKMYEDQTKSWTLLPELLQWSEDILHLLQLFQVPIENCAMQVYYSALPFISGSSLIVAACRTQFKNRIPRVIRGERSRRAGLMVLGGHFKQVTCLCFSPDGRRLITGSWDKTLRLWDAETGKSTSQPLIGHIGWINRVAFSPNGGRITSGSEDKTVRFWDGETGAAIGSPVNAHTGTINCLAFSPDGSRVASGSDDRTIRLWDPEAGVTVGEALNGHTNRVFCLSYSPDGSRIASGSWDNTLRLWEAESGAEIGVLVGHLGEVYCLTFSPNGRRIASGSLDKTLRLWDVETYTPIGQPLIGHTEAVYCLAYSPDGKRIVSGSYDTTVRIWDATSGSAIAQLTGHTEWVTCLAYSPDGKKIASGSWDYTVRLWDAENAVSIGEPIIRHTNLVNCLSFSSDGRKITSGSDDRTVQLVDIRAIEDTAASVDRNTVPVTCFAFSPDGRQVASGSEDATIGLWDAERGDAMGGRLKGHSLAISCLAYSPDGMQVASGSQDCSIRLWDVKVGVAISKLTGHTDWVNCLAFSPSGEWIISSSDDETLRIWDARSYKQIGEPLVGHSNWVTSVSVSLDGSLISSTSIDDTRLWDASSRTPLAVIPHWYCNTKCRFQYLDGNLLLVVNNSGQPRAIYDISNPRSPSPVDFVGHPSILFGDHGAYFKYPWTTILSSQLRVTLPSDFQYYSVVIHRGKVAYGGEDGSVIILDYTHLL